MVIQSHVAVGSGKEQTHTSILYLLGHLVYTIATTNRTYKNAASRCTADFITYLQSQRKIMVCVLDRQACTCKVGCGLLCLT
jgi:hypothetical protein